MFSPTNRKYFPKVSTAPTDVPGGLPKIRRMGRHDMTNKRTETKTCTHYTYKDKDKVLSQSFYCPRPDMFLVAFPKSEEWGDMT